MAVILVGEFTVKLAALVAPNTTAVAPVNPVPVTVTLVPPVVGPFAGEMLVTVGKGGVVTVIVFVIALLPAVFNTVSFTVYVQLVE